MPHPHSIISGNTIPLSWELFPAAFMWSPRELAFSWPQATHLLAIGVSTRPGLGHSVPFLKSLDLGPMILSLVAEPVRHKMWRTVSCYVFLYPEKAVLWWCLIVLTGRGKNTGDGETRCIWLLGSGSGLLIPFPLLCSLVHLCQYYSKRTQVCLWTSAVSQTVHYLSVVR